MRARLKSIMCFLAVFFAISAFAQLKTPSEYVIGELPNGITYYLVRNTSERGCADISLVQRSPGDTRLSLDGLSLPGTRIPWKFFSDRGVAPGPEGYVAFEDGAAIYNFRGVPVTQAFDSTLFIVSSLTSTSPCRQAVVVCGDIDVAAVTNSLKLLSLPVPTRQELPPVPEYKWEPDKPREVSFEKCDLRSAAVISVRYYSPRFSEDVSSSTRPFVAKYFSRCLSLLLESRLQKVFAEAGIPLGNFSLEYLSSGTGGGDETHIIEITTSLDDLQRACNCFGRVISDISEYGVTEEELRYVRFRLNSSLREMIENSRMTNRDYAESCVHSYLYGMSLTSLADARQYMRNRVVDFGREAEFFNAYVRALLGSDDNCEFVFKAARDPDIRRMMLAFDSSRSIIAGAPAVVKDTAMSARFNSLMMVIDNKSKITSSRPVRRNEGTFLTFSNGMRVVYRKAGDDKMVDFSLMLPGGLVTAKDFEEGESAFVQDVLQLCSIGGIPYGRFIRFLSEEGITLKFHPAYSEIIFYGTVPESRIQLLFPLLAALQQLTPPDEGTVENYLQRISVQSQMPDFRVNSRIDSLLRPGEKNYPYRRTSKFRSDTPDKVVRFVKDHLARTGGSMLFIAGDINEGKLTKLLSSHIGLFPPVPAWKFPPRALPDPSPASTGTALVIGPGLQSNSARIKLLDNHMMNRETFFSFRLAALCLKDALSEIASSRGFSVAGTSRWATYPEDNFTIQFDLVPCPDSGLPLSVGSASSVFDLMADVHTNLRSVSEKFISRLPEYKELLFSRFNSDMKSEQTRMKYLVMMYSENRDMVTESADVMNSVDADAVREIIDGLLVCGRVEYITR